MSFPTKTVTIELEGTYTSWAVKYTLSPTDTATTEDKCTDVDYLFLTNEGLLHHVYAAGIYQTFDKDGNQVGILTGISHANEVPQGSKYSILGKYVAVNKYIAGTDTLHVYDNEGNLIFSEGLDQHLPVPRTIRNVDAIYMSPNGKYILVWIEMDDFNGRMILYEGS